MLGSKGRWYGWHVCKATALKLVNEHVYLPVELGGSVHEPEEAERVDVARRDKLEPRGEVEQKGLSVSALLEGSERAQRGVKVKEHLLGSALKVTSLGPAGVPGEHRILACVVVHRGLEVAVQGGRMRHVEERYKA